MSEIPESLPDGVGSQGQEPPSELEGPSYTSDGELIIESIDQLSRQELRDWVHARLHGRDPVRRTGTGERLHYLLTEVYPHLDRRTCEAVQNILIHFLNDLGNNPESDWLDDSGEELLILMDPMLLHAPRK